jgi:hypothetical protein
VSAHPGLTVDLTPSHGRRGAAELEAALERSLPRPSGRAVVSPVENGTLLWQLDA